MARIFVTLAAVNSLALLTAFGVGMGSFFERLAGASAPRPDQPLGTDWFMAHFASGLTAAFLTLLVHCLIFTYFLGTGRWVKEVARAYSLRDDEGPKQTRAFKRQAFPPALFSMLAVVAVSASGAAAQMHLWPWWFHPILALMALALNGWAYSVEYRTVTANAVIMDRIMDAVHQLQANQAQSTSMST